ncbi:MAG: response regulator transcription factor [Cyclobacteriaceae bacterium]|nr:response regulator transcription factor [Cyclobacteriaceae bacterium]
MKILLIDNETDVRQTLSDLIHKINPMGYEIEEASGVETGIQKITSFQPDIVFLDIEMNDGTGFDLLKRINGINFQLIFTTAFNQYAIEAFKFSAIDYLMKPVDPAELAISLHRASENIQSKNIQKQLEIMLKHLSGNAAPDRQIVLKDMDATYFIKVSDILYCMAEGAYTQFFFQQSDPILVSRNLHSHEELLAPMGFIRTHHSCLVNPIHIKMFDRKTDSLVLSSGHSVPVSQRKKDSVIEILENRK